METNRRYKKVLINVESVDEYLGFLYAFVIRRRKERGMWIQNYLENL